MGAELIGSGVLSQPRFSIFFVIFVFFVVNFSNDD
jgi:hypothetical protein